MNHAARLPSRRRPPAWRLGMLAAVLLALAGAAWLGSHHKPRLALTGPEAVAVSARPLATLDRSTWLGGATLVPELVFRTGFVLSSADPRFGGWSAVAWGPDKTSLLALSDAGHWWLTRLRWSEGTLQGLDDESSIMAPVLGPQGRSLSQRGEGDLEALAITRDRAYIAHESWDTGVWGLPGPWPFMNQPARRLTLPPEIARLPKGRGLESLVAIAEGVLLAIAERDPDGADDSTPAWLLDAATGRALGPALRIAHGPGFDVSDAAFSPACGLMLLQRKLAWNGLFIRLVRLPASQLRPGTPAQGQVLMDASAWTSQVDNMEGLALGERDSGDCDLLLMSDDNFLPVQRTLLLHFIYQPPR